MASLLFGELLHFSIRLKSHCRSVFLVNRIDKMTSASVLNRDSSQSFQDSYCLDPVYTVRDTEKLTIKKYFAKKTHSSKIKTELKCFIVFRGLCPPAKQRLCYGNGDAVNHGPLWVCWKPCWWEGIQMDGGQLRLLGTKQHFFLWEARASNERHRRGNLWRERAWPSCVGGGKRWQMPLKELRSVVV